MRCHHSINQYAVIDAKTIEACGWVRLFDEMPEKRFYHHPDWFLAIDQYLVEPSLALTTLGIKELPVILVPWQPSAQSHRFTGPMHCHLSLGDVLIHPSVSQNEITSSLESIMAQTHDGLWEWQFSNVPDRSPMHHDGVELAHKHQRTTSQSAWFDLAQKPDQPSGKLKRNLRRLRGKLEEKGEIRTQWVSDPKELEEAYVQFLTLEASGWKGKAGSSSAIAQSPNLLGFYKRLLTPVYDGLNPVIALLWSGDTCIAAQYGLQTGDCLSLLKIAYSEQYSEFSPGSLLLQDVILEAVARNVKTLSLVTSPPWAERWHPETEPVWQVTRYAKSPGGLALRAIDRLKQAARATIKLAA